MLQNTRTPLDGGWKLRYVENKRFRKENKDISTIAALKLTGWQSVDAVVPGNFELDFERAGLISDPFFGCNTIENEKFENLHLIYSRRFTLENEPDENTFLVFEGIDTVADIFVNGKLIGQTDNMLIPFEFCGANLKKGENEIVIHITPAVIAAREYEVPVTCTHQPTGFDSLFIRKAPHMYGWDIMPRAVTGGIWRPCYVLEKRQDRIDDLFIWTNNLNGENTYAEFGFFWNLTVSEDEIRDYTLRLHGECGDSKFDWEKKRLWHTAGRCSVGINNPKLWWPHGYGDANLYDITATLLYKGEPVFEHKARAGLRTIELDRTSTTDKEGHGEFCFHINHTKIFWHGSNWVPVDAYHSRDAKRLPDILPMLTDIGCNCVRCWGGNVYEDDIFYDFCDENGIMVWQDFCHACGINPQTDDYCARFQSEVEKIVRRLRNHTSIILWAGDNEVDECYHWTGGYVRRDPNKNRLTREVIPKVLNAHDFTRPYIPSSPYVDENAFITGGSISEQHLWGPRDYFKGNFYRNSVCHFASETGYHGCPSPESLKRYIRPEQLWHWRKYPDNDYIPKDDWCCHAACAAVDGEDGNAYRIRLMSNQVKTLFPAFREHEVEYGLEKFAYASQISQAEAKKYFIERFRVTKWRRSGIIWWNLIDGWPQISDAVVDYYGVKKLAYHYIKRSQQTVCLMFDEPENGVLPLHVVSDLLHDVTVSYKVTDLTDDNLLVESTAFAKANESTLIWTKPMIDGEKHFYLIEWSYTDGDKTVTGVNHYMTNIIDIDYDEYMGYIKKVGFDEFEGF